MEIELRRKVAPGEREELRTLGLQIRELLEPCRGIGVSHLWLEEHCLVLLDDRL